MNTSILIMFIIQIILIFVLAMFMHVLFKESRTLSFENRLNKYSVASIDEQSIPFFEEISIKLWKIVRRLNKLWEKSELLKKYSKRFQKYISFNENDKSEFDFLSLKFLVSLLFIIIYLTSSLIQNSFNTFILMLVVICSYFILDIYLFIDYKKKRKQIEHDLLNAIIIMNNAFKSGMNIMQAVEVVKEELTGPIQEEFIKISIDILYGLSLDVVFDRFYNRVKIEDVKYITSSLSLINKTGGDIVKVFEAIEKNFYDKKKIKDEMNSLTSSSIFMFRLLVIMPLVLCLVIFMLNPNFFTPFFTDTLGRLLLFIILVLFSIYVFIIKKIMKVDV